MISLPTLARLAAYAYPDLVPGVDLASAVHALYHRLVGTIDDEDTDTHVYVCRTVPDIVVSFRGTADLHNALMDAEVLMEPFDLFPGSRAHGGFQDAWKAIWTGLSGILETEYARWAPMQPSVTFTGHSLGGAIATLCAATYGDLYPMRPHACVTFGSPRVGDNAFVDHFRLACSQGTRVVHARDIVPSLPASLLITPYSHVPGLLWIDDSGHECSSPVGLWHRLEAFGARIIQDTRGQPFTDHHMAGYIAAVDAYAKLHEEVHA